MKFYSVLNHKITNLKYQQAYNLIQPFANVGTILASSGLIVRSKSYSPQKGRVYNSTCMWCFVFIMPPPFEEWWRGIKCYPCPCVRPSVHPSVCASVIKIWCLLNNFWKTASIQFKFGMLIYNIKTQVEFDLSYNPLIFDIIIGFL